MGIPTLTGKLWTLLRDLRAANAGNITVTFALATVPMVGFVGAAVDYSHANAVKAAMQAAADSTALMLAKNAASLTSSQLTTKANEYFGALFTRTDATGLSVSAVYSTSAGSQVTVNASATVKADFMKLMGFSNLKVAVDSQAKWGTTKMQVALALDTTGSMAESGKMPALKTAAKELLTTLQNSATNNGDVRVAIVPFNKYVNVGSSNYNQNWIDWDDWDDDNGHDQSTTTCSTKKTGKSGKSKKKCTTSTTWIPDNHNTWNGCITDRDQDHDVKNTTPTPNTPSTLFPAEQADDCPARMIGLSFDWTLLKNKIDELQPNGMTNQAIGLAWAWQALSQGQPMNAPAKGADIQQIIILFSDGLNTQDRWYDDQDKIDARQALACANAKTAGITIYTVLVMSGFSKVMKDCASKPDYYYEVTSANQTMAAFSAIGNQLTKLRIAQ
jgi:Mg-chelatase subunit ChlD